MDAIGNVLNNGLAGYRQGEADKRADDEYEYKKERRGVNDEFIDKSRIQQEAQWDRNGVLEERQNLTWERSESERERKDAINKGMYEYSKSKITGDYSGLIGFMQQFDNNEEADIMDVKKMDDDNIGLYFDDGSVRPIRNKDFEGVMSNQLSPENWSKVIADKNSREAKLTDVKALATFKDGLSTGQKGVSAGLKAPTALKYTNEEGNLVSEIYQKGKLVKTIVGAEDPVITKARNTKEASLAKMYKDDLSISTTFVNWATKLIGSSDKAGNFFLPKESIINAVNLADLGETIYRASGGEIKGADALARAVKFIRSNPALSAAEAKKQLIEQGIDSPGWTTNSKEDKDFAYQLQELIYSSNNPKEKLFGNGLSGAEKNNGVSTEVKTKAKTKETITKAEKTGKTTKVTNPDVVYKNNLAKYGAERLTALIQKEHPNWTPPIEMNDGEATNENSGRKKPAQSVNGLATQDQNKKEFKNKIKALNESNKVNTKSKIESANKQKNYEKIKSLKSDLNYLEKNLNKLNAGKGSGNKKDITEIKNDIKKIKAELKAYK